MDNRFLQLWDTKNKFYYRVENITHALLSIAEVIQKHTQEEINLLLCEEMNYNLNDIQRAPSISLKTYKLEIKLNIDWKKIEALLSNTSSNILVIPNYLGILSENSRLKKLKNKYQLNVVSDSRHLFAPCLTSAKHSEYNILNFSQKGEPEEIFISSHIEIINHSLSHYCKKNNELKELYSQTLNYQEGSVLFNHIVNHVLSCKTFEYFTQSNHSRYHLVLVEKITNEEIDLLRKAIPSISITARENKFIISCLIIDTKKCFKDVFITLEKCSHYNIEAADMVHNVDGIQSLLQSESYTKSKAAVERKLRNIIHIYRQHDGVPVASCVVLLKKYGPFTLLRINQGPAFNSDISFFDTLFIYARLFSYMKKNYKGILILKPNILNENFEYLKSAVSYLFATSTTYSSGVIYLSSTLDTILNSFTSSFRNRLKKCNDTEELSISFDQSQTSYSWIRHYYVQNMHNKKFAGIPVETLDYLYTHFPQSLLLSQAILNEKPVSSVITFLNGNTATYLIGYNSEDGRKHNVNNLQFWEIIKYLKTHGYKYFDLGGIDHENTPDISTFKERMNPAVYTIPRDLVIPLL